MNPDINFLLQNAVFNDDKELIKKLVDKGANINMSNGMLLSIAVENLNLNLVKFLCTYNIKKDAALKKCIEKGDLETVTYLTEHGAKNMNSLRIAIISGKLDIVKYLIENGSKIDDLTLKSATSSGFLDIVKFLVNSGVTITRGVLYLSTLTSNHLITKYLLDSGADPNEITLDKKFVSYNNIEKLLLVSNEKNKKILVDILKNVDLMKNELHYFGQNVDKILFNTF